MSTVPIDDSEPAKLYDDALRWEIPSRSNPHEVHIVELNAQPGYSICTCMHFQCRLLPLLARGVTPEQAVAQGLVKLAPRQRTEDSLKCQHIYGPGGAEHQLAQATIRSLSHARQKNTAQENRQ